MKWMAYIRGTVPIHRIYSTLFACIGKIRVVIFYKKNEVVFAWLKKDLKNKALDLNLELAKKIEKELLKAISISEIYLNKKFHIHNIEKEYYDFFNKIYETMGLSNIYIDAFDEFYETSDEPKYSSYMAHLHNDLYDLKNNFSKEKLNQILDKYWWTNLGWESMQPLTEEEIIKRLDHINEKVEIEKTGNDMISIFAELHDLRKELQMKSCYVFYKILKIITKEKKISVNDLEWLLPEELFYIDNIDKSIIKKRQNNFFFDVDNEIKMYYGDDAIKRGNELLNVKLSDFVKGRCAYKGKVEGIAKICKGVQEASKIKKGEILITGMTTPDYVPYMKLSSAIVTNEGGLTCHAAIISREMKIPCVVGTIHATEIFKSGDLIEVDAENGVVRKLK